MSGKRMTRNYIVLSLVLICLAGLFNFSSVYSQAMSKEEASAWAENWFNNKGTHLKKNNKPGTLILEGTRGHKNIYLACFDPTGFVVFSSQENPVVLAYSLENTLPKNHDHPLFGEWVPAYSRQLANPVNQKSLLGNYSGPIDIPGMDGRVEPLVEAEWGQGIPWNKYCPADGSDYHAAVGCVAVALAQIMNKWEWPVKGYGENSYVPASHPEYGTVEAVFDTTYYQWDQMHNTEPTDASALILFHAGVSTNMNYGPNESGSNTSVYAANALKNHFLYNQDMILREKDLFSYDQWAQLLRQDIVNGRPVLYRGTDPDGGLGHAFNIDGFRDEYFFHFNWGWNGEGNGYYRLEAMGDGGGNFTKGQAALFGIQPTNLPQHDRPFALYVMAGDGFVQLFWDEPLVSNLSHYNIYRDGELIESTWETHYRDEDLINGVNYSYHLSAQYLGDRPGESEPTPSIDITPWEELTIPYSQNFDTTLAGWQIGGSDTSFQWNKADSLGFSGNETKVLGIRSDRAGPGNKVTDYLISPLLDIRGMDHVGIKFDYVFQQVPQVDFLFIMYRRYDNGLWYPIYRMDSTDSWSDWQTFYSYFPDEAKNTLIQLGFFYTDYYGDGKGAAIDNVELFNIPDPPVPDFSLSHTENCQNNTVTISHQSTGLITHWSWDFGEGAEPRYAYDPGPHDIIYKTGGQKTVNLILNHLDQMLKEDILDVSWETRAEFTYDREGLLVSFENQSDHPETVHWDFGDGNTSTEINPIYQYRSKLIFEIELICYSPPCQSDTMKMELDLRNGTGIEDLSLSKSIRIYPNPASNFCDLDWTNLGQESLNIDFVSFTGSVIRSWEEVRGDNLRIDLTGLSPGIYWLKIRKESRQIVKKILIL